MCRVALACAAASLVAWACACGGCHSGGAPPAPSTAASTAPDAEGLGARAAVGLDDEGKTLDVPAGATVTFRLPVQGGTGYAWMPAGLDGGDDGGGVLSFGERRSEPSAGTAGTPGGPRADVYEVAAQRAGTATVEMDLVRPWEKQAPAKTLRVTVRVH